MHRIAFRRKRVYLVLAVAIACGERRYSWAYAENLGGSLHPQETCRKTLADVVYRQPPGMNATREGNIITVSGTFESYRIVAFHSEDACTTALAAAKRSASAR